jgi:hypothetical protein
MTTEPTPTSTILSFEVNEDWRPVFSIFIPKASCLNGYENQVGPYSPDEARALAAGLIAEVSRAEWWVNDNVEEPSHILGVPAPTAVIVRLFEVSCTSQPSLFVIVPEPSFLNGDRDQMGPFTSEEVLLLAARLISEAPYAEQMAIRHKAR